MSRNRPSKKIVYVAKKTRFRPNKVYRPMLEKNKEAMIDMMTAEKTSTEEVVYYEENPSMFRNQPVWFVLTCILCLVGVGLIIFLVWWIKCKGTTLTVTSDRTSLRKGILSKSITEVWHKDVRNVQLNQTFFQRIFDVGTLGISSSGQSGIEIAVSGMPDPDGVKDLIDKHRPR